ncbi:hypothetical protein CTRI78_v009604 [Colletotrichum trifolii]|uniref:Uncharacterized protein n=1 Tax=Colletotrichum trifolii TaxID=5466 RepID=A0A4V6QEN6_COLTR|nr:hypothetical protein CTRI78_v009604 [Colletotrichum trifolii]
MYQRRAVRECRGPGKPHGPESRAAGALRHLSRSLQLSLLQGCRLGVRRVKRLLVLGRRRWRVRFSRGIPQLCQRL